MKQLILITLVAFSIKTNAQINPNLYNKPLPEIIQKTNQSTDFKLTSHIVNIKVPSVDATNWNENKELEYIKSLFDIIPDKDFLILSYDDFYFPDPSYTGAHSFHIQNQVENIGLPVSNNSSSYNSNKLLRITRLTGGWDIRPNIVTHEIFHLQIYC